MQLHTTELQFRYTRDIHYIMYMFICTHICIYVHPLVHVPLTPCTFVEMKPRLWSYACTLDMYPLPFPDYMHSQGMPTRAVCIAGCITNKTLPTSQAAFSTSQAAFSTSQAAFSTSLAALRTSQAAFSTSQAAIPTNLAVLPTSQAALPTSQAALPTSQAVLPTSQAVLTSKDILKFGLSCLCFYPPLPSNTS